MLKLEADKATNSIQLSGLLTTEEPAHLRKVPQPFFEPNIYRPHTEFFYLSTHQWVIHKVTQATCLASCFPTVLSISFSSCTLSSFPEGCFSYGLDPVFYSIPFPMSLRCFLPEIPDSILIQSAFITQIGLSFELNCNWQ